MRHRHADPVALRAWKWAGLWGLLILALTSVPGRALAPLPTLGVSDLTAHALVYIPLGLLVLRALELSNPRMAPAGLAIYATAICLAFAAFDELHQYPIPGRFADVWDWVADAVGAGVGIVAGTLLAARNRRLRARRQIEESGTDTQAHVGPAEGET